MAYGLMKVPQKQPKSLLGSFNGYKEGLAEGNHEKH